MNGLPAFSWSQADSQAISYDSGQDAWHAGIVKDLLVTVSGNVIVATDSGGIWSVSEAGEGICLIDTDKPDMWCLAQGPLAEDHLFAGGETLFETDVSQAVPLLSWNDLSPSVAKNQPVGEIFRIVVLQAERRIVIATATGVYWAEIPPQASSGCLGTLLGLGGIKIPRPAYRWTAAAGLPPGRYGGLALGPPGISNAGTLVTAAWGNALPHSDLHGLFYGDWSLDGNLTFGRAQSAEGVDPTQMCFTQVASHAQDPSRMYASSSDSHGNMVALLGSEDGGATWSALPGTLTNPSPTQSSVYDVCHGQGNDWDRPCNALGAGANADEGRIAIGWRAGPLLSGDGGHTFALVAQQEVPHLHGDFHCMLFDPYDQNGNRIFIGSDGGIAMTPDFGNTFVSTYSRELLNLQLLGTTGAREWYGSLGVSPAVTGLVATGTQDNGNLVCQLKAPGSAWIFIEGGDGRIVSFLANNSIFHYYGDDGRGQLAVWNGSYIQQVGVIPYYQDRVLTWPLFERVEQPAWRDPDGRLMYGVAAVTTDVYGLQGDANADNTHWRIIGSVPTDLDYVSAVSSRTGSPVLAGTWGGRIFQLDPANDLNVQEMSVVPLRDAGVDPTRVINRIVIANEQMAFASYNRADRSSGSVLHWDGLEWRTVSNAFPSEYIYAMEIDVTGASPVVYLATDAKVYASADLGGTWQDVSAGLPKRPHNSDLRLVQDDDGTHLYLSTFGRSLWRGDLVSVIPVRPQ